MIGEAANGAEAIEQFNALKPELMTLDITMPEKDGLETLKDVMELDPGAKVIMCSALGQESKVLESIKLGAKDFVVKPFQPDRVIDAVGKALSKGLNTVERLPITGPCCSSARIPPSPNSRPA